MALIYRPRPDGKENTFLCQEDILAWNRVLGVSRRAEVAGAVVLGTGGAGQTLLAVFNRRGGRVAPIYRVDRRWPSSLTEIPRWPIVVDPGRQGGAMVRPTRAAVTAVTTGVAAVLDIDGI